MNEKLQYYINKIYRNKEWNYFREKCAESPIYLRKVMDRISTLDKKAILYNRKDEPAIEIYVDFQEYSEGNFHVEYKSVLKISKVANIFNFQHEYSIVNIDPNRMSPVLEGFSDEAYIFEQNRFDEAITKLLLAEGLEKLSLADMEEVIGDIQMPQETIFGSQMTIENCLFRDLFEICCIND